MAELARPVTPITSRRVTIRDWYVSNYCNDDTVAFMMRVQNTLPQYQSALTRYCEFLSLFGEPPFYTFFIPIVFWVGFAKEAALFCIMMSVTLYFVDNMKDLFACPRPPCPPLRRAGKDSHGMEYGMPSSHTSLGMMCAFHVCLALATMFPHAWWLVWFGGVNFVLQTGISRIYLGLHWPADLITGGFVFVFAWMLQELVIRDLVAAMFESSSAPWFLFILGHILNSSCASPVDPCPCYSDTVRFCGAAVGATTGAYIGKWIPLVHARVLLPNAAKGQLLFTLRFWLEAITGFIVIAVCKEVVNFIVPRVLKPMFVFLSGSYRDRLPEFLRGPYTAICTVAGWLLLRRVYPRGIPNPEQEITTFAVGTAACAHNDEKEGKAHATMISPGTAPNVAGRGQLWSYKTNNYWWLWDIHRAFFAYIVVGMSATTVAPHVWNMLFTYDANHL